MTLLFPPSKNKMLGPDQDNYVKLVATAQSKAGLITSHIQRYGCQRGLRTLCDYPGGDSLVRVVRHHMG